MACALFVLLIALVATIAGVGVFGWFGGRRVARYLRQHPEAAKQLAEEVAEHVLTPLLIGDKAPEAEDKPEPKKTKGTLI